jgi:peptidyl-prolyl cis-trans isomerase SurA
MCAGALLISGPACRRGAPANIAAEVNGYRITYEQLDKYFQSQAQSLSEKPDEEQAQILKLNLLRELIDNQMMLQRAERLGLMAVDTDVDAKLTELKAPYTAEEFEKQLKSRGLTVEEMKTELRRSLSIQKLFNREITAKISISDGDLRVFYDANKANFSLPEPQVHLAQILVTGVPDPQVRNLMNDKAKSDDEARRKIQMIEARLRKGEDFGMLAQNYSEDPNSSPNGGDLGFVPQSALDKADLELRRIVALLNSGQTSPIVVTPPAYRIIKVISKEPAGQREFSDPRVQQTIRETLLNRKDQLLKAAYYEMVRNESKVVNYLAQNIVNGVGQQ